MGCLLTFNELHDIQLTWGMFFHTGYMARHRIWTVQTAGSSWCQFICFDYFLYFHLSIHITILKKKEHLLFFKLFLVQGRKILKLSSLVAFYLLGFNGSELWWCCRDWWSSWWTSGGKITKPEGCTLIFENCAVHLEKNLDLNWKSC